MKNKFPLFMLFFCGVMLLTCASIVSVKYNSNYISYNYLNLLNFQKTGQTSDSDDPQNDNSVTLKPKRNRDEQSENSLYTDTVTQQSLLGGLENITTKKPKNVRTDPVFSSQDFMSMISDDAEHYGADVGLAMLFSDQEMNSVLISDLSKLTKSLESQITSQHIFDVLYKKNIADGATQIQGLDVTDEAEIAALLLSTCFIMFVLVSNKNEKIKLKNTKFLSIFFIVILLSSATLTPFSMGQKYWGMAFAEPFNQTNNTLSNGTISNVVNSTFGNVITNSTIVGVNETSSLQSHNETTNYNMPSLTSNLAENLTNSTVSRNLSHGLSDALSIYDNSTILQNHVSVPIHGNITISSDVGIADNVATSYNGSVPIMQGDSNLSADVSMSDSIHITKTGITIPNATKSWDFASDNGTEGKTEIQNNTLTLQGNGYVHENIDSSNILKNFTISAWVKPDYSQGSPVFTIISKTNQFALDLNNNVPPVKDATFSVFDGVRWNTVNSTVSIPANSWTYLAGVYNGTSISLYVNGTLQSSYDLQGVLTVSDDGHLVPINPDQISSNYDMVIGASINPTRSSVMNKFSGNIQNVNFYKQILGPEQISKIYLQNTLTANHYDSSLGEGMTVTDSILMSLNSTNNTGTNSMQVVPTIQKTKSSYSIGENPEFVFKVFKDSDLKKIRAEIRHVVQQNGWNDKNSTISVKILAPNGTQIPINAQFAKLKEGQFDIKIPSKRFGKPGMYTIQATLIKNGKTYTTQEQYAWGLVSVNTDKSIYMPGQAANMTIVVLDSHGSPVCNAQVSMNVISPNSGSTLLSSGNGITQGPECGLYDAQYATTLEGNYTVNVSAKENSINTNFSTSFLVQNNFAFDITRTAQSKIDPKSNPNLFGVKIDVTSFTNATSVTMQESVPAVFDVKTDGTVQTVGDTKIISWNKSLVSNKTSVQYSYSVPMVFPQLYALGPVKITYGNNTFTESRQWFVANDPPADTIQFDGTPISQGFANGSQKNMSLTIDNNSNRLLLVQVAINSASATVTAFWQNNQLTPLGTPYQKSSKTIEFLYLVNPPTGTANLVVDTSSNTKGVVSAYSLYGVDQTTPVIQSGTSTTGSSLTPSFTLVNTNANSLLIDLVENPNQVLTSTCATCTTAWENNDGGGTVVVEAGSQWKRTTTSGSSTTFSWSIPASKTWLITGAEVIPAGIAGQTDTVSISDQISKLMNKTLTDSPSITDQVSVSRLVNASAMSDQAGMSDQLSLHRTRSLSLSDSMSMTDQLTALHFNDHYYDGLPVTITTSATSMASFSPTIPAGDNIIIVSAQFNASSTTPLTTVSSGNLQLKKNGAVLTSNPFDINIEGDTQGTEQASTVLLYKDVGASANPTYDVTALASQTISGEVKILVIHEAPNSSFGNSTVVALPSAKSTLFSHTSSVPSGDNLVLAEINLHNTGAARTFAAGALTIDRSGNTLSSNVNIVKLDVSTGVITSHSILLIASDTNAPANPTYDITTDPSSTGVNGQAQVFVIQGLKYSFVDGAKITTVGTSDTQLASGNILTNGVNDKIATIAAVENIATTSVRTISPGGMKLNVGGVVQSTNEFGMDLKSSGIPFRDHVLLDSNNNFGQNPVFNVTEAQSNPSGITAAAKVATIDLNVRSTSLTDNMGITELANATGVKSQSLSDAVGINEQISRSRLVNTTLGPDQISISDQVSAMRIAKLSLSDSLSISEHNTELHFNDHYYNGLPVTITTSATSMASFSPTIPAGDNIIIVSAQFDGSATSSITTVSGGNLQLKKNGAVLTSNPFDINVEGDLSGTKQASTVLLYKDTGASANPTYDVTALASQAINGTVKILVIHEAPNSSFGNSTVVALPSAKSTLFSHTSGVPSGDNLVLAEINLHNTVSGTRTFAAGALTIDRSGNTLSSNENAFTLDGSTSVINSHSILLIASDTNAPANPTYDITTDPSNTGVNGQVQVFVIHGLKYSFVDGSNTALTTADTTLATNSITTNGAADTIASIAAVETKDTGTTVKTISPGGMKIVNGSAVLTSNEFGIELKSSGTQFRDHVLLYSNNNLGKNPTFGITEAQSTASGVNGETKVVLIDLSSKSIGLTDSMSMSAVPSFGKSVSVSDSVGMSETMSTSNGPSKPVSDSVTMSESVATKHGAVMNHSDSVTISDGIEITKGGSNQVIIGDTTKSVTIQSGKTDLIISSNDTALSTVNVPSDVSTATLNYSKIASTNSSSTTIGIVNSLEIKKDLDGNGVSNVQMTLPANITVTGSSSWKGDIIVPTITSAPTIPSTEGQTITVSRTIEIGSSKVPLSFDKAVRILFVGEAGKKVGYFNSNTSFTEIAQACSDDTQTTNNGLASGGNCKINVGSDLVVWTKHFTGFSTFTSTSTSGTASSSTSGNAGGGGVGAATSGVGASSSSNGEGGEGPYLKIQNISYDICDKQVVRIQVGTDVNSTNPMVIIRTSLTGVVYAHLAQDQPYEKENDNADIRQLVYEAPVSAQEKSFEVVALESVGHNIFSVGKTIDVTDCKANFDYSHIGPIASPGAIDTSAPKIFDVKFQTSNGTKVPSSEDDHFVDSQRLSVFAIVDSLSSIDSAEIRFEKSGDGTTNYQTILMTAAPLQVSNTTYIISGVIPQDMLKSPDVSYWINVKNSIGKTSESDHYTLGIKPAYAINGKLEFDLKHQNRAEGSTGTPIAYFTNYSDGPLYGTVSLVVDGVMVYTSPAQEFGVNQTAVPLEWKTPTLKNTVNHHLYTIAQFYGKSIISDTQQVTTFHATKTVPITDSSINIDVLKDKDGNVVATPQILHASYAHTDSENFKVVAPDGTCVIGPVNCLVTNSTNGVTQYHDISIGDQNYRVRYFEGSTLERFTISSVDPIIGKWHVEIDSNGILQHDSVTDNVFLEIKYSDAK